MCECSDSSLTDHCCPSLADSHQIWPPRTHLLLKMFVVVLCLSPNVVSSETGGKESSYQAYFNITYKDASTNNTISKLFKKGRFGVNVDTLKIGPASGMIVHVRTVENKTDGCEKYAFKLPSVKWIALIARGDCSFEKKIRRAAVTNNASAVVVYQLPQADKVDFPVMTHSVENVVAITIPQEDGEMIAKLADQGINVTMDIKQGKLIYEQTNEKTPSKTSVVFVSVSFIVLMIISLAWLVFYYIQRFRYAHAKERLARRLASAAKKAIAKIPQKTVKNGDKEMNSDFDQCAVCIEGYKAHDVIRTLPCKHVFHKSCVDPWLLDQRSCPMCKLDILRAYGMHVGGSEDSVHPDGESGNAIGTVEDLEQTSVGDEQSADGEVKVLLLPQHLCLHHEGETSTAGGRSSMDSSHATCDPNEEWGQSGDSECTELHSLMDHIGAANVQPLCTVDDHKDTDLDADGDEELPV